LIRFELENALFGSGGGGWRSDRSGVPDQEGHQVFCAHFPVGGGTRGGEEGELEVVKPPIFFPSLGGKLSQFLLERREIIRGRLQPSRKGLACPNRAFVDLVLER